MPLEFLKKFASSRAAVGVKKVAPRPGDPLRKVATKLAKPADKAHTIRKL